jgi:hypothetical protein
MTLAKEDETERRILGRLIPGLQPCLKQSLQEWLAVDLYHGVL